MIRFLILFYLFVSCENRSNVSEDYSILAKVGNRTITKRDFLNRAEYTIRPIFCKGNLYYHKKIILNNLIAEKLLALESENIKASKNIASLDSYLKGRKEQAMRQLLYFKHAFSKVELTDDEIQHYYKMAGRTYEVNYFSFPGGAFSDSVASAIDRGSEIDQIYKYAFKGSIPEREVNWIDSNDETIDNLLFSGDDVSVNQVFGPIKLNDGSSFVMKIKGWKDNVDITKKSIEDRIESVSRTLKERKALRLYSEFVGDVMKGKSLLLDDKVFPKYAESLAKRYFTSEKERESAVSKALFEDSEILQIDKLEPLSEDFKKLPLFSINQENWTIKEFEESILSHPLVFRKRKMSSQEFPSQLKLAIIDFVQDYYLTQKAYEMKLDEDDSVILNEQLWSDSFYAFQYAALKISEFESSDNVHEKLKPLIDELQIKHSSLIKIDMDMFEEISISNVDMFATQSNVPYPVIVPSFPAFTDDSYIDYGSKISRQ